VRTVCLRTHCMTVWAEMFWILIILTLLSHSKIVSTTTTTTNSKNCKIEENTMKVAYCDGSGTSSIKIEERSKPVPTGREVMIRVVASGLNRIDTYMSKGAFGKVDVLGMEVSGVVEACGDQVKTYKKGDSVMALLTDGGHSQYVVVDERHVIAVKGLSIEEAAAIPEQWLTAFQLLFLVGEMKQGDNVLIHAGGSGVGKFQLFLDSPHVFKQTNTHTSPNRHSSSTTRDSNGWDCICHGRFEREN